MMAPDFASFIHRLCVHFDRKDPLAERMDSLFKDVKGMDATPEQLEAMHDWFVATFDDLPKNVSKAMWAAHAATRNGQKQPEQAAGSSCKECRGERFLSYTDGQGRPWCAPCGRCNPGPHSATREVLLKAGYRPLG